MKTAASLFFFAAAIASAQCLQHAFNAPRNAALPSSVIGVADFDGDGKPDLLRSDAVYLDFTRRVPLPASSLFLRIADANRDGRPDLLGGNTNAIIAMINKGDGTFTVKTTPIKSSLEIPLFYWADFNGDGVLDVFPTGIVLNDFTQSTPAYIGNGDGTFNQELGYHLATDQGFLMADLNGDHRADIVTNPGFVVTAFYRQGNSFSGPQKGPTIFGFPSLAADFDRDGRDDVVFTSTTNSTATTIILFDPSTTNHLLMLPGFPRVAADLNGDGAPDLLIATAAGDLSSTGLQAYLNDGHGNFHLTDTLPADIPLEVVADMDGDGIPDLLSGYGGNRDQYIVHGNGDGTFRAPRIAFPAAESGVVGDFDGDGDDDVAVPGAVLWNDGNNVFRIAPSGDARLQHPLRAADFDGDGKMELVSTMPGFVLVLSLRPDGTMAEVRRIVSAATEAAVGDFTGTHHPELALLSVIFVEIYDVQSGALRYTSPVINNMRSIAAADLNGDGKDDLIAAGGTLLPPVVGSGPLPNGGKDGFVSVFMSNGASFEAERHTAFPAAALHELVTGDFDGDGKLEVAASPMFGFVGRIVLFSGYATSTFPTVKEILFPTSERNFALRAADLDGDGRTDLSVNGTARLFFGSANGLVDRGSYFGPQTPNYPIQADAVTYFPLLVRPSRNALPWIIVPTQFADVAYVYRPACARPRAVRH